MRLMAALSNGTGGVETHRTTIGTGLTMPLTNQYQTVTIHVDEVEISTWPVD